MPARAIRKDFLAESPKHLCNLWSEYRASSPRRAFRSRIRGSHNSTMLPTRRFSVRQALTVQFPKVVEVLL